MSELATYNSRLFNKNLLKFRIKYYFHETGEALLRHKLLLVFLFCLLLPGFKNIQLTGVPFRAILDPGFSFTAKCISLFSLLVFLSILIRLQVKSIKGGELRDYFSTLSIPPSIDKKVDLIVLVISMNITWLALFFGAYGISAMPADNMLLYSYYALYFTIIVTIIAFLLNVLYKNVANMFLLTFLLMLVAIASMEQNWFLNIGLSFFSGLSSVIVACKVQPNKQKGQSAIAHRAKLNGLMTSHSLKLYSSILLATVRENKTAFVFRFFLCLLFTVALAKLLLSDVMLEDLFIIFFILIGIQSYVISTLATIFSKNELDYRLFHLTFQYSLFINRGIEIICMIGLLSLSLAPLILFSAFLKPIYLPLIITIMTANIVTVVTNRMLYAYSFRFCFFTSLINTAVNVASQYLLVGAFLGT